MRRRRQAKREDLCSARLRLGYEAFQIAPNSRLIVAITSPKVSAMRPFSKRICWGAPTAAVAGETRRQMGVVDTDEQFSTDAHENLTRIPIVITTPHATPHGHERFATI